MSAQLLPLPLLSRGCRCSGAEPGRAGPARGDIAWRLGFDADVMSTDLRWREFRNWLVALGAGLR